MGGLLLEDADRVRPLPLKWASAQPISFLSGFGSKLPLPLYADVKMRITMTHHTDVGPVPHTRYVLCPAFPESPPLFLGGFPPLSESNRKASNFFLKKRFY